jgi:hypothetical protein
VEDLEERFVENNTPVFNMFRVVVLVLGEILDVAFS